MTSRWLLKAGDTLYGIAKGFIILIVCCIFAIHIAVYLFCKWMAERT